MDKVNLGCPNCKAHLTLPADKENNDKLLLVCPKCNFSGKPASFIKLQSPQFSGRHKVVDQIIDPTIIVEHNIKAALTIGCLKEIKTQKIYQLRQGLNRFGRESTNSVCEHQFSNNDTFISREHFEIDVIFNKVTLVYDHRLKDLGSKNGTKIKDQRLSKGDIVLLQAGDRVLAGKTELIFELLIPLDDTVLL